MKTYRVVLDGDTLPDFAPEEVRHRLAALVGLSEDVAAKLLGGRRSTVKRGIDETTALRYVEALTKIGVACHVKPDHLEPELDERRLAAPPANTASQGFRSAVQSQGNASRSSGLSWHLASSLLAFALLFSWLIFGAITQLLSGAIDGGVFRFAAGFSFAVAALIAGIFYAIFYYALKVSLVKRLTSEHRPGRRFLAVAAGLLIATIVVGVVNSYYKGEQLKVEAKRKEEAVKAEAVALKAQQDRQRAEIERTKAEGEARDAALAAKFKTKRGDIIANLKQLISARKYQEAIDLGNSYAWAKDRELDALKETAVSKNHEAGRPKAQQASESHKRGVCGHINKGVDLLLYDTPAGHGSTATCLYTDDWLLVKPNREIGEDRMARFRFLSFIAVGALRNDDFFLPDQAYVGYGTECRVMKTNDAATSQRLVRTWHDDSTAWRTISSLPNVACPK